ncbi:replicative DNA helicase [Streptomyces sp. P38-E01]|uniref:Replicative DNA helicase n=1 Tax=Streptomyces tardus TaxID=2780544 RepID=A0A949JH99_9ACTN|nr:DnaB-like helicase N-terminal domain-containing protein [Streptomyces tardus]MBU7598873.1 replicative DNA helicase [Streptomyces tardus]
MPPTHPTGSKSAPSPVDYAEQALLGALLLEPHRTDDVTGITADSFSTTEHTALYTALATRRRPTPTEHATSTKWLEEVLAAARQQARGLTTSYLHTLTQVCPRPAHAPAYARMIESAHARRRLQSAAERLVHTVHDVSLPHPARTVLATADELAAVVDDIATRFPPRTGARHRAPALPLPAARDSPQAVAEEQILLATATAYPDSIEDVPWLLPDDLTLPLHAGLWRCLTTLTRHHEPIDRLTVLWEAAQRGLLDSSHDEAEILHVLATPAGSVEHWATRALHRALLATAEHTGRRINAYATDLAITPFQLVAVARRAIAEISAVRARWQHASPAPRQSPHSARVCPPTTTAPATRAPHPPATHPQSRSRPLSEGKLGRQQRRRELRPSMIPRS